MREGECLPPGTDVVLVARRDIRELAEREGLDGVRRLLAETLDHAGVMSRPLAFLRHRHRSLNAAQAVKVDDVLSQGHDAYSRCDVLSLERSRDSSTIPTLERLDEGLLNGIFEA